MTCDWPIVRLGDYIDSCLGKMLDKKKNKGTEQFYLGNSDVRWGSFDLSKLSKMKFEENEHERYGIKKGDLIVCEGGEPGRCAIWQEALQNMKIQKALHRIRTKESLNNYYLYYWFLYSGQRGLLEPYFTGTTIKHLTGKALKELELPLPPLSYQKRTARILKSIDDKIQLNRQINQTLEQIAQALFKSWFVDFEPTRAKIAAQQSGQDPERAAMAAISGQSIDQLDQLNPEQLEELKTTAALFPDTLVDSELGEIPEGWSIVEAKAQLDVLRGFSYKGKGLCAEGEGVPMHNLNSIQEGGGYKHTGIKYYKLEYKEKFKIKSGDVLVANTEQGHNHLLIGYGSMVPSYYSESFFSHHLYRVRPKKNSNVTPEFVEQLFKPGMFVRRVQGFSNGTTVNMLPISGLEMTELVCPPKPLAQKFSSFYSSFFKIKEKKYLENINLQKTRDRLLPELLSGGLES